MTMCAEAAIDAGAIKCEETATDAQAGICVEAGLMHEWGCVRKWRPMQEQ